MDVLLQRHIHLPPREIGKENIAVVKFSLESGAFAFDKQGRYIQKEGREDEHKGGFAKTIDGQKTGRDQDTHRDKDCTCDGERDRQEPMCGRKPMRNGVAVNEEQESQNKDKIYEQRDKIHKAADGRKYFVFAKINRQENKGERDKDRNARKPEPIAARIEANDPKEQNQG